MSAFQFQNLPSLFAGNLLDTLYVDFEPKLREHAKNLAAYGKGLMIFQYYERTNDWKLGFNPICDVTTKHLTDLGIRADGCPEVISMVEKADPAVSMPLLIIAYHADRTTACIRSIVHHTGPVLDWGTAQVQPGENRYPFGALGRG